jgi:hypothetical protein
MAVIPRPMSREEVGLARDGIPPGAERLLAALLRRGLDKAHLFAAAQLAIALDEGPSV